MHFFGFHSFSVFIAFETKKILKIMKKSSSAADQLTITFATNSSPNHKFIQTCVVWRNLVALHENTALDKGGEGVEVDLQVIICSKPSIFKTIFCSKLHCPKVSMYEAKNVNYHHGWKNSKSKVIILVLKLSSHHQDDRIHELWQGPVVRAGPEKFNSRFTLIQGVFYWSAPKNDYMSDYIINPIEKVLSVGIS